MLNPRFANFTLVVTQGRLAEMGQAKRKPILGELELTVLRHVGQDWMGATELKAKGVVSERRAQELRKLANKACWSVR
jgi:hypothetical protein